MKSKLFIIGNGFDIAHHLPTRFNPNFKNIAMKYEHGKFWDLYQSCKNDIWSDFENLLARLDFNGLEEIFNGYGPDYSSDRESDRDSIIYQVELNGRLQDALNEFANNADDSLGDAQADDIIERILNQDGYYITFNYTHTLEKLYSIPSENILHIHGEVGKKNLVLGYPKDNFTPEKYRYDIRGKGRGPYSKMEIEKYIDGIEDYYIRTAYEDLFNKCKSFYKEIKFDLVKDFLNKNQCKIEEIIVYGHSCAIDFDYFSYLNTQYPNAFWKFCVIDEKQKSNVQSMIRKYNIKKSSIVIL